MVGLIGLAELIPLVCVSLVGGTLADRLDRRRLLLASQVAMLSTSAALAVGAVHGSPPVAVLFLLAGIAAGGSAIDRPSRARHPAQPGRPHAAALGDLLQLRPVAADAAWSARRWAGRSSPCSD